MQFVLLHHTGVVEPHFDLMFETRADAPLRTFRVGTWPMLPNSEQPATALPDHRRDYLTYEGPVSGNRGEVKRIAAGVAMVTEDIARIYCSVTLEEPSAQSLVFELQQRSGTDWVIRRAQ